jgi:hypothetical protein
MPINTVHVKSAGAARTLIGLIAPDLLASRQLSLACEFGPLQSTVDRIAAALRAGQGCGLGVLTRATLANLGREFGERVRFAGSLGCAATGLVANEELADFDLSTPEALRQTLKGLDAFLAPDMTNSTGGRHLREVLRSLDIAPGELPPIHEYAGGAEAVAALASFRGRRVLACAQGTEISGTAGVRFVGRFPGALDLSTEYIVATVAGPEREQAELVALAMTGPGSGELRRRCGFADLQVGAAPAGRA